MDKIQGISAETVERLTVIMKAAKPERLIAKQYSEFNDGSFGELIEYIQTDRAKITALLASGEVVLRKDVEKIRNALHAGKEPVTETGKWIGKLAAMCDEALAKFTKGETK